MPRVVVRMSISSETQAKLADASKKLGLKWNSVGALVDLSADAITNHVSTCSETIPRHYGRFTAEDIRAIRCSPDKDLVLAMEHSVSEMMISLIRRKKSYAWVE